MAGLLLDYGAKSIPDQVCGPFLLFSSLLDEDLPPSTCLSMAIYTNRDLSCPQRRFTSRTRSGLDLCPITSNHLQSGNTPLDALRIRFSHLCKEEKLITPILKCFGVKDEDVMFNTSISLNFHRFLLSSKRLKRRTMTA